MSLFPQWREVAATPGTVVAPDERLPWPQTAAMGVQHVIAMFGATVLAPILMGFDPNVAILMSGIGTLIFFVLVGGRVPSYLGSSFAFIGVVIAASGYAGPGPNANLGVALGGIIACGAVYTLIGLVVMGIGTKWVETLMPPVVTGAVVAVIGLNLAGIPVKNMAPTGFDAWMQAVTFVCVAGVAVFELFGSLFFGAVGQVEALPAQLPEGTRCVVLGAGPIGLGCVIGLKRAGARDVVVLDRAAQRRDTACRLGADLALAEMDEAFWQALAERHGSVPFYGMSLPATELFIDCSGAPALVQTVVQRAAPRARIQLVAVYERPAALDLTLVMAKELELRGVFSYGDSFPDAIDHLARHGDAIAPYVSHRVPLSQVQQALALAGDPQRSAKVLVIPD